MVLRNLERQPIRSATSVIGIAFNEYEDAFDRTRYAQDVPRQGGAAARQLVAEVQGAEPPASFAPAAYELVVRGSTAPPRASG